MSLEKLLSELEEKAKAATKGPWHGENLPEAIRWYRKMGHTRTAPKTSNDGDFIATCNPSTVERLIAIIRLQREFIQYAGIVFRGRGDKYMAALAADSLVNVERIAGEK